MYNYVVEQLHFTKKLTLQQNNTVKKQTSERHCNVVTPVASPGYHYFVVTFTIVCFYSERVETWGNIFP